MGILEKIQDIELEVRPQLPVRERVPATPCPTSLRTRSPVSQAADPPVSSCTQISRTQKNK